MTNLGPWQPLSLRETADLFAGFGAPWWIAGGWAIDLFLGRQTRPHGDVDVSLLRADQPRLRALLPDWDIHVAHAGELTPWEDGDWLTPPRHQFWARPTPDAPWALEFLLEDHDGDRWRFRRNAAITLPLERLGRPSAEGLPYICPEVALLFKAGRPGSPEIERNAADFAVAAPTLDRDARTWLRSALSKAHPGHPWIGRLRD